MEDETRRRRKPHAGALLMLAIAHTTAVGLVAFALAWLIAPLDMTLPSYKIALNQEAFRDTTILQIALHVGLSACLWFAVYLLGAFVMSWRKNRPKRAIRVARGTVMTETIIVMPVFFLLCFGLAQLAVNNIAGILANVAAYQAARAAWVWKGEEGVNRLSSVSSGTAAKKARLAAALVMTPVAPGEFIGNPLLSDSGATDMRSSLALMHIPLSSAVGSIIPGGVTDAFTTGASVGTNMTTRGGQSLVSALDSSMYIIRGLRKFTHAYHATSTSVSDSATGDTTVSLTYKHFIAMPTMGRVFGSFGLVGLRPGYYSTFTRSFGFKSQGKTLPNPNLPTGTLLDGAISGPSFEGAIRDEVGDF